MGFLSAIAEYATESSPEARLQTTFHGVSFLELLNGSLKIYAILSLPLLAKVMLMKKIKLDGVR